MPGFLNERFVPGGPLNQITAYWFRMVSCILNNLTIVDSTGVRAGEVFREATGRSWRLVLDSSAGLKGYDPFGNVTVFGDTSKPWVKFNRLNNSFSEEAGPMPVPHDPSEIWWEKARQHSDIVVQQ